MVIQTLLWPDEIRDPDFPVLDKKVDIKPAELKMASQVVESMTDDFNPDRYHDDYQEQLHELIQAKLEGGEAFTTEEQPKELDETEDVSDLLAKLEASVKARATAAPAATSRRRRRRRRRPGQEGAREEGGGEEGTRQEGREEGRGEEVATRADPPAAQGARRVSGAARRPSDGRCEVTAEPAVHHNNIAVTRVRRCRSDRRTDRTTRAAWRGNTASGATRSTWLHTSVHACVITKSSEVVLAFGVSTSCTIAIAARRDWRSIGPGPRL